MHIQIHKQDHQLQRSDAVDECSRQPEDVVVIDSDDDDDFEICTKPCAAADFASEDEYRRHMLRHVRPVSIRVPKLELSSFKRIPYRIDAFYLPRKPGPACSKAGPACSKAGPACPKAGPACPKPNRQILVGGFRVEVTNLSCLRPDFVYEVVQRIVDPALLEPIVLLYVVDANGRLHIVSGVERMSVTSVDHFTHSSPNYNYAATSYPVAASSYQKPEQRSQRDAMEELAFRYGVPLDYLIDVTRSFGSSHFMLNSPMSQFPLPHMPAKPRNRSSGMPRQTAPAKKPPSEFVVLRNADGSQTISGEINLTQTSRIVTGPLSTVSTAVAGSFVSGAFGSNAGSRLPPTSASSASNTGRSLLTNPLVTSGGRSTLTSVTPRTVVRPGLTSHLQNYIINGGPARAGSADLKVASSSELLTQVLVAKSTMEPHKQTRANENGVGNPLVMKRVPLSVRQPPYPKMVPADRKMAKSQSRSLEPVFVSAGEGTSSSPSNSDDVCDEVIDLLSDDENNAVEREIDQNDIGAKKVNGNEIGQKKVDENDVGPKEFDENDVGQKKVDENFNGLKEADEPSDGGQKKVDENFIGPKEVDDPNDGGQKKVDDVSDGNHGENFIGLNAVDDPNDGGQKKVDVSDGNHGEVDDNPQILDEVEEIIVLE